MATIYTIKGTDSISSSRLNINDNFDNLNTELAKIFVFFTPASGHLTLTGTIQCATLATTGAATVTTTLGVTGEASLGGVVNSGRVLKSGIVASSATLPTATNFTKSTYQVGAIDVAVNAGATDALENGVEGQEILIVAVGTADHTYKITPSSANISGVTTAITLTVGDDKKESVLLRYVNSKWRIISCGDFSGVV